MHSGKSQRGVTLLELFFALGLVALLAGLAAPGFHASVRAAAVRGAGFELLAGLQQTRALAIVEARPGLLCPVDASGACLPASRPGIAWRRWLDGQEGPAPFTLPADVAIRATRSPLRFYPTATAASTGTLTICDMQGVAAPRAIVISQTGRARLAEAPPGSCS